MRRVGHYWSDLACRHASSTWGLPWWCSGKESACRCRGHSFSSWLENWDPTCLVVTRPMCCYYWTILELSIWMLVPADHFTFTAVKIYRSSSSIPFTPKIYWQRINIIYKVWDKSTSYGFKNTYFSLKQLTKISKQNTKLVANSLKNVFMIEIFFKIIYFKIIDDLIKIKLLQFSFQCPASG